MREYRAKKKAENKEEYLKKQAETARNHRANVRKEWLDKQKAENEVEAVEYTEDDDILEFQSFLQKCSEYYRSNNIDEFGI